MISASKIAVVVLLCLIAGCKHKTQPAPPPAAQAPILPPSTLTKDTPPPQLPPVETQKVGPPGSDVAQQPPPPKPRQKTTHHKPKPADQTTAQAAKDTPPATTQQASAGQPPEMSPIGQLSSTGGASSLPSHHDILEQINLTENGLKDINIKRTLTTEEQVTANQIHTFLNKAKQALEQDDLDGANTLVTKAKVLLAELTKS